MTSKKKIQITMVVSVLLAVLYGLLLQSGFMPVTKEVIVQNDYLSKVPLFKLASPVSLWWNILLFPIAILIAVMMFNTSKKQNESKDEGLKTSVLFLKTVSIFFSAIMMYCYMFIDIMANHYNSSIYTGGPITALTYWVVWGLAVYLFFGFFIGFGIVLFKEFTKNDDKTTLNTFIENVGICQEVGLISSLPIMFGLLFGFILRIVFDTFAKVTKGIVYAFRKSEPTLI